MLRAYRQTGPVGSALDRPEARGHQRAAVSDPAIPRVPLGQRRLLQRLLDPQHRRMLLDEGRLAGLGQGVGGTLLSRRLHRPELRHLLRRVHLRRRHQAVPRRAEHRRLQPGVRQLRPRHQRLGGDLIEFAQPGPMPHLQGPEVRAQRPRVGVSPARAQSVPGRVGRPDPRDPQGQALQRGQARRRGEPRHLDGPDGRPHRAGHHLRADAQLQVRVRAGRRQAHHDQPRPAPARSNRQSAIPPRSRGSSRTGSTWSDRLAVGRLPDASPARFAETRRVPAATEGESCSRPNPMAARRNLIDSLPRSG